MNVLLLLSIAASVCLCVCDLDPNIRFFPPLGHSVAGVFQVSYVNSLNQPYYAFNASDARSRCESLGVNIASVSQVINALTRGLETCRFGWTDEHLAVVPRVTAQVNCGQNQTGLVRWRAPITKKFDVFCFNESDADTETRPTVPHIIFLSSATIQHNLSLSSEFTQPSVDTHSDSKAEKALRVGSTQGSSGKKTVVITSVVAVFLVAIVAVVYIKVKRNSGKEPYIEGEEWTHVKYETKKNCQTKVDSV
ncbi:hypothetical protein NQD34_002027 [Periophthalmus magnuspinnatus]|uniref:lymphatic vessel endothelial hyaluronic acid receptor 1a n=1 Tax=Periophthalmus magnuspinnatus TaxID=409849 RepID=UPI00145A1788|nr:lymphatic vessel endothelial hyaluronic acid receptor 1a [Periophthalmus magnuspinnatus]KAJ0002231.1 hypothetical protein NQD34_002027 [Periophthalmus magnuspinnatus]